MTTYDKPKRKNIPAPQLSIWKSITWLMSSLVNYGLVAPIRWTWRMTGRLLNWGLRQSGVILIWSWRTINFILQNTIFAPFIFVGRLLGFVANAVPKGLSPIEVEAYQRINRQFRRQKRWYLHIIVFLMSMATLWITEMFSYYNPPRLGMAITMTVVWLMILGGHRLWMNLGESEDREIGEALYHIRQSQQAVYYEEEIYEEQSVDSSRLEEIEYAYDWDEDEEYDQGFKSKRQGD